MTNHKSGTTNRLPGIKLRSLVKNNSSLLKSVFPVWMKGLLFYKKCLLMAKRDCCSSIKLSCLYKNDFVSEFSNVEFNQGLKHLMDKFS